MAQPTSTRAPTPRPTCFTQPNPRLSAHLTLSPYAPPSLPYTPTCTGPPGSPHPLYTRFIDRFSGADYEKLSLEVCRIMDQASAELGEAQARCSTPAGPAAGSQTGTSRPSSAHRDPAHSHG